VKMALKLSSVLHPNTTENRAQVTNSGSFLYLWTLGCIPLSQNNLGNCDQPFCTFGVCALTGRRCRNKFDQNVFGKFKINPPSIIYLSTLLTCGHELWVMTARIRSQIQVAKMSFVRRVSGFTLKDGVRSVVSWEELREELLLLFVRRS